MWQSPDRWPRAKRFALDFPCTVVTRFKVGENNIFTGTSDGYRQKGDEDRN